MTLYKVVETMPQQMRSVIKAKGGPTKISECAIFFGQAVYKKRCIRAVKSNIYRYTLNEYIRGYILNV